MRDLTGIEKNIVKDEKVVFNDGNLYVISISGDKWDDVSIDKIILNAEYDEPLSLADIAKKYPDCHKLIYEDYCRGEVYNHNNHYGKNEEAWELVGRTIGYV